MPVARHEASFICRQWWLRDGGDFEATGRNFCAFLLSYHSLAAEQILEMAAAPDGWLYL
jgi:hypothetical protein